MAKRCLGSSMFETLSVNGRRPSAYGHPVTLPFARLLEGRLHGRGAWVPTLVAVVAGVIFVSFGIGKFTDHASEAVDFRRYEVPFASLSVWAVGVLELLGGLLLIVGLLVRPVAAALGLEMVGVVVTA